MPGRDVTLVFLDVGAAADADGDLMVMTRPLTVASPWWPHIEGVVAALPAQAGATVVRLVRAVPGTDASPSGG